MSGWVNRDVGGSPTAGLAPPRPRTRWWERVRGERFAAGATQSGSRFRECGLHPVKDARLRRRFTRRTEVLHIFRFPDITCSRGLITVWVRVLFLVRVFWICEGANCRPTHRVRRREIETTSIIIGRRIRAGRPSEGL